MHPSSRCFWTAGGFVALGLLLPAGMARQATGDEVVLRDGGRLEGQVQTAPGDSEDVVVALPGGGSITLEKNQVLETSTASPAEAKYREYVKRMPDTAEGHWRMAQWCGKSNLIDQQQTHLRYVLQHDPDHQQARKALGYHLQDGQWVRPEEKMEDQGLVRYQGRWRLPQEVAIKQQEGERKELQGAWYRKIRLWRRWLESPRAAEAEARFAAIDDPMAGDVLIKLLADEENSRVRELYVATLGRLDVPSLATTLIQVALMDGDPHVRQRAVRQLKSLDSPHVTPVVGQALKHKNNQVVNRAGYLLGELNDRSAVPDLIEALNTVHRFQLPSGPNMQASFGQTPTGAPGLNGFGAGERPKYVDRELQNRDVHRALVKLTGVDFGYGELNWWNWYGQQRLPEVVNLRRSR